MEGWKMNFMSLDGLFSGAFAVSLVGVSRYITVIDSVYEGKPVDVYYCWSEEILLTSWGW